MVGNNYLLVAVVIAIAIGFLIGYRKGFLRLAVSVAGLILVILIVTKISPYVSDYIINNTDIYSDVRTKIITIYEERSNIDTENEGENNTDVGNSDQNVRIKSIGLPAVLSDALISNNTEDIYSALAVTLFEEYVSGYLAKIVIKAGSFFGLFIVLWIAQMLLFGAIKILEKIPVLKSLNRFLGAGLGTMVSLLFIWIFFLASLVFFGNSLGNWVIVQVNSSQFLTYLFNSNMLFRFIL